MSEFDPLKAIREELQGLAEVNTSLRKMEQHAEEKIGQAETELNSVRKVRGYLQIEITRKWEALRILEQQQNNNGR